MRHSIRIVVFLLGLLLVVGCAASTPGNGIPITPDKDGRFTYTEDFATQRFLTGAFLENMGAAQWQPGEITNTGPNVRAVIYRFYGERAIKHMSVSVEQLANPQLGGVNNLQVSSNGLDWKLASSSGSQASDAGGWQGRPLTVSDDLAAQFVGGAELWVRLQLANGSGVKTNESNRIRRLEVTLDLGDTKSATDSQAALHAKWGKLRANSGWQSISLDRRDPISARAPHYYEDSDGYLLQARENPDLRLDESEGFLVHKEYMGWQVPPKDLNPPRYPAPYKFPLSFAAFVRTQMTGPLMAALTIRCTSDGSRNAEVLWDGKPITHFDAGSYFTEDRIVFVDIPAVKKTGVHELRVKTGDRGRVLMQRIELAGSGLAWVRKPKLPAGAKLDILSAYYMPDRKPPADSAAMEGAFQSLYKEHDDFGGMRVVVRNSGKAPARISSLCLNGKPVEEGYVDLVKDAWDARGVVWYRIRPRLLQPGECGQVYMRFRRRPAGRSAAITVNLENGKPIKVSIAYKDQGLAIDYITTGRASDVLYTYVRRSPGGAPGAVSSLSLDGVAVRDARVYGTDYPGNVALVVAKLPRALRTGDYHVVGVKTGSGESTAAQFRVLPFVFTRSSINVPPEMCREMHMNHAMWNQLPLETCEKYDLTTTCAQSANGVSPFDTHRRVAYVMAPDEVDAYDNVGGGYDKGLGYNARIMCHAGWAELIQRYAPWSVGWMNIDGTTRPMNWAVYGQFADISGFDPYPVTFYGANQAFVRESLSHVRKCSTPQRFIACLEAFGWPGTWEAGYKEGVGGYGRGPVLAELRQNVVQALGAGAKGLTSWVYSAGVNGWQDYPEHKAQIARMMALVEQIQDYLLLGTPIDLATSDAGLVPTGTVGNEIYMKDRVAVSSLLCGPDTIIVTAANHIPASRPKPPKIEPARDVTITVKLPGYLPKVKAFEATDTGLTPIESTVSNGNLLLKVDSIESGRVFVLRRA